MSATDAVTTHEPSDVVRERLNDPAVAAALVTILDNAELLSTLLLGLAGFVERGDTIMDSVASGVGELKAVGLPEGSGLSLPSPAEITGLVSALTRATPVMTEVLESPMVSSDTVELLGLITASASEGAARARQTNASVTGLRAALRALKDPDVGRGLGLIVEIAKALGRNSAARSS